MKKITLLRKKLELSRDTIKILTDERHLAQLIGGRRNICASSESNGQCSGNVNC